MIDIPLKLGICPFTLSPDNSRTFTSDIFDRERIKTVALYNTEIMEDTTYHPCHLIFEQIKKLNKNGQEYLGLRDLCTASGYSISEVYPHNK